MTTTRAAERAAWAAAGALATLAALAGLAVHWGRAVERNEQYGTHMATPGGGRISGAGTRDGDVPYLLSRGGPVCGFDVPLRSVPGPVCELPGCVLHEPD